MPRMTFCEPALLIRAAGSGDKLVTDGLMLFQEDFEMRLVNLKPSWLRDRL